MKNPLLSLLLLPLMLLLTFPAQAQEKKDYIFKGLPDYRIDRQTKNFNQLVIKSKSPEGKELSNTYEGNLVETRYYYQGPSGTLPSDLQIFRNYQEAVKKLGGEILSESSSNRAFFASFKRNDKQYYMKVSAWNPGYTLEILEIAELQIDVEIIDSDTMLHKLEKDGHIALYINFDTGKSTIKPDSKDIIDEIVTALKSKPQLKVKLEGHTDNVGGAADNKKLSDSRAKAVMDAIVAKGIDKSRLSAEGLGMEKPVADNGTEEGRAKNRRVEMVKVQ